MKKMAIKGLVTLAAVVALCMFFSGTIKTISTAKVKLVTAKQGKLEEEILAAGKPGQDNYTAIVLKYHGKNKEES